MKIVALTVFLCIACAAHAQQTAPVLLQRAVHCLAAKHFLPGTPPQQVAFGYLLDTQSSPGEKMLYVVDYSDPSKRRGTVFTIYLAEYDGHQTFNIQNNARFAPSRNPDESVEFLTPPLGGAWTQQHLISAIREIEKQPTSLIPADRLLQPNHSFSCESYTDPQPQKASQKNGPAKF